MTDIYVPFLFYCRFCDLLLFPGEVRKKALTNLCIFLCHRYPRVSVTCNIVIIVTFFKYCLHIKSWAINVCFNLFVTKTEYKKVHWNTVLIVLHFGPGARRIFPLYWLLFLWNIIFLAHAKRWNCVISLLFLMILTIRWKRTAFLKI